MKNVTGSALLVSIFLLGCTDESCSRDEDCPIGEFCETNNKCSWDCKTNSDCNRNQLCNDYTGRCYYSTCNDTCSGCCSNGQCVSYLAMNSSKCGTHGANCKSCSNDETCSWGECIKQSCYKYCTGCCSGDTCKSGTDNLACGKDGWFCSSCSNGMVCLNSVCSDCTSGQQCSTYETCYNKRCTSPWGKKWTFTILGAAINPTKTDGSSWDWDNSSPDVFVVVVIDSTSFKSGTISSYTPTWTFKSEAYIFQATKVQVSIYDEDTLANDYIGGFTVESGFGMADFKSATVVYVPSDKQGLSKIEYSFNF